MFRKLCQRHRNTFPHICAVVLLVVALVPLYVSEKRGRPVELWYVSTIFVIAFALFCYGITAPANMKKVPLRKQLTALYQDFFGLMWPFCYFYKPKPVEELYPSPPLDSATHAQDTAQDEIIEDTITVKTVENDSHARCDESFELIEAHQAHNETAPISVSNEYFSLFESIMQEGKKLTFKEALQLLEKKYPSKENPFVGQNATFYFAEDTCIKLRKNGKSSEVKPKTLENRYSAFLQSQKNS